MKTGFQNSIKKSAENRHPFYEILGPFWGPFGSGHAVLSPLFYKCVLHVGTREAGYIKMGPKIDEVWVLKSMIFVIFFDRFFGDFMFNFVSWPGRPDKRRAHTEHTQSTHRGNQTGKSRSGCVRCMGTRRRILRIHIRTNMRTQSHEDSHEDAHDDSHEDSHEGSHEYR